MTSRSFLVDSAAGQARCLAYLRALGYGSPHMVIVTDDSGAPTARDFREFYAVLTVLAEQAVHEGRRYSVPTWEEFYKAEFIGREEVPVVGGGTIMRALSKTSISRREFAEFLAKIRAHAATEFGVVFQAWE